jgi:hypothetical protein
LDTLRKCRNRVTLRNSLAALPLSLEKTYDRILCAIGEQDAIYATRILRWLTFAERPLSLDELAEVVAIEANRDPLFDKEEVLEDPMEALDICSSLVSIVTDVGDGKQGSTRKFAILAHYSVKEYLLSDRIRNGEASRYSMQHGVSHGILARACLGYLLQIFQSELKWDEALEHAKLARYCAEHWMNHAEEAGEYKANVDDAVVSLSVSKHFVLVLTPGA